MAHLCVRGKISHPKRAALRLKADVPSGENSLRFLNHKD